MYKSFMNPPFFTSNVCITNQFANSPLNLTVSPSLHSRRLAVPLLPQNVLNTYACVYTKRNIIWFCSLLGLVFPLAVAQVLTKIYKVVREASSPWQDIAWFC